MSYEDLKKYVDEQKEAGVPNEEIRHALNKKKWAPELIDKAIGLETIIEEPKIPTIKELLINSWNTFADNASTYIISYAVALGLGFLSILILASPMIYAMGVLKLDIKDMISSHFAPVFVIYFAISLLLLMIGGMYGQLIQIYVASFKGMKIIEAMKKSWTSLPSYIWLTILVTLFLIATAIPAIILFGLVGTKLISASFKWVAIGSGVLLLVPFIYFSITMFFTSYAFIVHGARGKTAIRNSYNIVKNRFWWILGRVILLWIILAATNLVSQIVPFIGIIIGFIITPFSLIYFYKLYISAEYQYKNRENLE